MILVGEVVRGHGIRGEVVVHPHTENPLRFQVGAELLVGTAVRKIVESRPHGKMLLVAFQDIGSRTQADQLRGALILVEKNEVPPAPEGAFWEHELVGCEVFDTEENLIGIVTEIIERAGQDLWRVAGTDGGFGGVAAARGTDLGAPEAANPPKSTGEVLIPAAKDLVVSVDVEARRIVVELPGGFGGVAAARGTDSGAPEAANPLKKTEGLV